MMLRTIPDWSAGARGGLVELRRAAVDPVDYRLLIMDGNLVLTGEGWRESADMPFEWQGEPVSERVAAAFDAWERSLSAPVVARAKEAERLAETYKALADQATRTLEAVGKMRPRLP